MRILQRSLRSALLGTAAFSLAACSGPTAAPLVASLAEPLQIAPAALTFSSVGAPAQTFVLTEPDYAGTTTLDETRCNAIATAGNVSSGSLATGLIIPVTPVGVGNCTIVVTDQIGHSASLQITVT